jgi:transposase
MHKPDFTEQEIEQLYRLFMSHPLGMAKKKLHVVYLKALGLSHQDMARIARVSSDSVTRYVKTYIEGGVEGLCSTQYYCPVSLLLPHRDTLKTHFQDQPPHTVAEAAYKIEELTGAKLALSACRDFMRKHLGMRYRKMAPMPAKADPDTQKAFLHTQLEPLLEAEKQGQRRVFFVDAAHFVMGAFLGLLWCFERLFVNSSTGRHRYNVLGAYSVKGAELISISNHTDITSDTLVDLLATLRSLHPDTALTLVMDNARYQHWDKVISNARELGIDLLFLPPYSPNLNLIERLWKFVKKQCLYNRYYEAFCQFTAAIDDCLDKVKSIFNPQVKTLLNPKFQLFEKSANLTA